MKKCLVILSILITFGSAARAQTFSEWFKQKKTQKKYLVQQIAALQVYIGYVKKGYKIAQQGLTAIGDFKNGEFNLHQDYFNSLKNVNPSVQHYDKVAAIIALETETVKNCHNTFKHVRGSGAFAENEVSYISKVLRRLMDDCADITGELITLITSGELEMKDDERLERIDRLYVSMQDDYTFMKHFDSQISILAVNRHKEKKDTKVNQELYGIKNK